MRTQHLGPGAVGTVLVVGALAGCSSADVPTARATRTAEPATVARRPQPTEPGDRWTGTAALAPDELNVRVWDVRTATVVADLDLTPRWVVESDGPCGGPASATIELPPA